VKGFFITPTSNQPPRTTGQGRGIFSALFVAAFFSARAWPDADLQFTPAYTAGFELRYTINFTTTGVYTVWLRGYAPNAAGDSLYVALDDQPATAVTGFGPQGWRWTKRNNQGDIVTIEVRERGLHTLHLWQREDGLRLDRIVLTTDSGYNPSGDGPPESEIR